MLSNEFYLLAVCNVTILLIILLVYRHLRSLLLSLARAEIQWSRSILSMIRKKTTSPEEIINKTKARVLKEIVSQLKKKGATK
jgi:hypothetical protein